MNKLIGILFLILVGCGTRFKDRSLIKAKSAMNIVQLNEKVSISHLSTAVNDSIEKLMEYTILPKGKFKYSTQLGFEGEAAQVFVREKQKQVVKKQQSANAIEQSQTELKTQQNFTQQASHSVKETKKFNYGIGITLAVLILLWICYLLRRTFKVF